MKTGAKRVVKQGESDTLRPHRRRVRQSVLAPKKILSAKGKAASAAATELNRIERRMLDLADGPGAIREVSSAGRTDGEFAKDLFGGQSRPVSQ